MAKYISKLKSGRNLGYQVRVPAVADGVLVPKSGETQYFNKGKGTWKAAYAKALVWRNAYMKKNKIEYLLAIKSDKQHPMINQSSNASGIIGITLMTSIKNAGTYHYYRAVWSKDCKQHSKSFSRGFYGECEAFLKACRIRFANSGTLIITDIKAIPCLPDVDYKL